MKTRRKLLIVEDNPSDLALARRVLARKNIVDDLAVAEDGQEALEYLHGNGVSAGCEASELPIVMLLDLKLPKIRGLEVLRRIRANENTKRIPVVILTSSKEQTDIAAAYDLGANSFIQKPIDSGQFSDTIERVGSYWLGLNEPPAATQLG